MKTPTAEQMDLAAEWLDCHDGGGKEGATMATVAKWLRAQAEAKELRASAREYGVPVRRLREVLNKATP